MGALALIWGVSFMLIKVAVHDMSPAVLLLLRAASGFLGLAVIISYVLAFAALFISATAVSVMVAVATVIWIVLAIVWVLCLWKALSGERWKLPLAGDYAERLI